MADPPRRPRFADDQTLAAADLELVVDHTRDREARHDRALHTPGIALGLRLATQDVPVPHAAGTVLTKTVTITAGVAIAPSGAELVLGADRLLRPEQFQDDVGEDPEHDPDSPVRDASHLYPVLLAGSEREEPGASVGSCGGGGVGRVVEDVEVRIGRRGEHLTLADQAVPAPGDALEGARPTPLLLGFVRYLAAGVARFVEVTDALDGVRVRRAGVRAGEIVSPDRLQLRAGEPATPGQPTLALEPDGGGRLRFGRSTATGGVDAVFTVATDGTVDLGLVAGTVHVQSGIATDGMPLPLPPGVAVDDVTTGRVVLHTVVTPRYPATAPHVVVRCDVDDDLVVHCETVLLSAPTAVVAGSCRFLVTAAVASAVGGAP